MPILGIIASQQPGHIVYNSYESIATFSGASATSITFSSIPSTYKHLQLRFIGKSNYAAGAGPDNWNLRFNSDATTTNYYRHTLRGNGASVDTPTANDNVVVSAISDSFDNASTMGVGVIDILDYGNTNKYKTVRILSGIDYNGSGYVQLESMLWSNTAAISTITCYQSSNWNTKTQFALYGIKG
jgi:hypothetical protein